MNPLTDPEDLDAATLLINQYAVSDWAEIVYSRHAREQLRARYIPEGVLEIALGQGVVVEFRTALRGGALVHRYKVRFVDKYGAVNVITVVAGFHKLRIITVFPDESDNDKW